MATQDLPQLTGTPQVQMPEGNDAVASRVAQFGSIVQNFTGKTAEYAGQQVGLQEKVTEMTLKTNIDNAMRAFAHSSTNQFDPKSGISAFEQQADEYTNKLMEGQTGIRAQYIKAYATNSKLTQLHPMQQALVKQAFNETKMSFLQSVDSFQKDISQNISQVPLDETLSHHQTQDIRKPRAKGMVKEAAKDLSDYGSAQGIDKNGIDAMLVHDIDSDTYTVIPKINELGEAFTDEEALTAYDTTKGHLGVFDNEQDAKNYLKQLKKPKPQASMQQERNAPSIDSLQFKLTQVLNNIEAAGKAGLISPRQAIKLRDQVMATANDEMLYHKYQLAVEHGKGDEFIASYARANKGRQGAAVFAKHIAEFKKIENRNLAEQAISESTARGFVQDNIKNLEMGKPLNTYADTLATRSPTLFPNYGHDKAVAQLSGGLYQQFTAGTEQEALSMFTYLTEKNKHPDINGYDRGVHQEALDTALKNAQKYFTDLKADPQKFLLEKNLLGDIAQQQKIQQKNPVYLPDALKVPMADILEASITWQSLHGIPKNQASIMTNAQAKEFGGRLLSAEPADKVKMIQSINKQYGKYANNVMQQMIKQGSVPREYGWFVSLDPNSGALPDVVEALTNPRIKYDDDQKTSVKTRVDKAMSVASEKAHPDVGSARRFLGMAYQGLRQAVTGREFDAAATNTGLFGTPALFPQNTSPDLKLKALTESYLGAAGYNTGELINTINTTVNKLTNYYTARGMTQDDALAQSVRALTDQYEMVDYRDNIIRLPKQQINYNDLSILLANTTELVNKVEWQFPLRGDYGNAASRTDQINYFKQNIENGHWVTDATDQGLVWVNANGMINKMENGNPLFVSFESIQKMQRLDLSPSILGSSEATPYVNAAFDLFKKNNVSFNKVKMGVPNDENVELNKIPNAFGTFEKMVGFSSSRAKEFYDYLFEDMQDRQRKFVAKQGGKK